MTVELFNHKVDPGNFSAPDLVIKAVDNPGPGGAYHQYVITDENGKIVSVINFQKGTFDGLHNGVTVEALLAIGEHRLECFEAGPFASTYNAEALTHIQAALKSLHQRTLDRQFRGVEGKHVV